MFHRTRRPSSASSRPLRAASASAATSAPRDWTRAKTGTCTATPALSRAVVSPASTTHFHRVFLPAPPAVIPRASSSSRLGARASRDARGKTSVASSSSTLARQAWRAREYKSWEFFFVRSSAFARGVVRRVLDSAALNCDVSRLVGRSRVSSSRVGATSRRSITTRVRAVARWTRSHVSRPRAPIEERRGPSRGPSSVFFAHRRLRTIDSPRSRDIIACIPARVASSSDSLGTSGPCPTRRTRRR